MADLPKRKRKAWLLTESEARAARDAIGHVLAGAESRHGQFAMAERVQWLLALDRAVDFDALVKVIGRLVADVNELGCTCTDRSKGHQPGCTGQRLTRPARAFLTRIENREL